MLRVLVVAAALSALLLQATVSPAFAASKPRTIFLKTKAADRKTIYCDITSTEGYAGKKSGRKFVPFTRETNKLIAKIARTKPKKQPKLIAKLNKLLGRNASYEQTCRAFLGIPEVITTPPPVPADDPADSPPDSAPQLPPRVFPVKLPLAAPDIYVAPAGVDSQGRPLNGRVYLSHGSMVGFDAEDDLLRAHVVPLGNGRWQLTVKAKKAIRQVIFPWQQQRLPLVSKAGGQFGETIAYYPHRHGVTEKASVRDTDFGWMSDFNYPGTAFAPLTVIANNLDARLVAATNWPPKRVVPGYAADRQILTYNINLVVNQEETFEALVADVRADTDLGQVPWQLALDQYRAWLDIHVAAPTYPEWLWNIHGWLNVQLENIYSFNLAEVEANWNKWKGVFPWIQFWGQMSNYAGGCCTLNQTMHSRYAGLQNFASRIGAGSNNAYHVGFYSAPYYDPKKYLDASDGRFWFLSWINKNKNYNANAYYYDVLGADDWGDPQAMLISNFMAGAIPQESVMEFAIDLYPNASLISGALHTGNFPGGPGVTPESLPHTSFPNFGRYLLGDRVVFMGESNGDFVYWGDANNNFAERQAFLLGAKFDVMRPSELSSPNTLNRALSLGIAARESVDFWSRRPVYRDKQGLTDIPSGIDVRRFRDRYGKTLLAVDNWSEISGRSVTVDGVAVSIPSTKLSIIDLSPR